MRRFLVESPLVEGEIIRLGAEEARHAIKALRLRVGDAILLTNGQGIEADAKLAQVEPELVTVAVLKVRKLERTVSLELLQAPLKGPKMDWLIEKITEIGVAVVHLARTQNTVAAGEKIDRWQRVAQAAMKQSGNAHLPQIKAVLPLNEAMAGLSGLKILLQPKAPIGLATAIAEGKKTEQKRIILAIGPEGGFTPDEESTLIQAGFIPAALSHQILRGETAAIAALAIASHSIDF